MLLWSENMLEIISIILNLLKFLLYPSMWSILENAPYTPEKDVYSVFLDVISLRFQLSLTVLLCHLGSLLPY